MEKELKERFMVLWKKYFGDSGLPLTFYYTKDEGGAVRAEKPKGQSCLICELNRVINGEALLYNKSNLACGGARRYLGYEEKIMPGFEYFLSCGKPGMEGERYIRTPGMVKELMNNMKPLHKEGMNIVFKRWDKLEESDNPEVVIFFVRPDVLAGLFTLANFDQTEPNGTISPFGSGCSAIVYHPYLETMMERQRAVIGMFDPSARKCVDENILSFALPMKRFERMIGYMEESFLTTKSWSIIRKRIAKQ